MIVKKHRIQNATKYLSEFKIGDEIRIAILLNDDIKSIAKKMGFSDNLECGESIVPDPMISKYTLENIQGKYVLRKDLPKEKYEVSWTRQWTDWGDNIHYGTAYFTRERWFREYLSPNLLELHILKSHNGEKWITSNQISITEQNYESIKLLMNIFLSIFGEFQAVNIDFSIPININKTLDWEILKPADSTDTQISQALKNVITKYASKNRQDVHTKNVSILRKANPEIIGLGTKGFAGYLVFYYPKNKIAILESLLPNNATYILNEQWETISKLSKTQILAENLHIERIFHYGNWENKLSEYV